MKNDVILKGEIKEYRMLNQFSYHQCEDDNEESNNR